MRFELVCTSCGLRGPLTRQTGCGCGGIRLVEYDMEQVGRTLTKTAVRSRAASMWRYAELLPVRRRAQIVSLGEGWTPLVRLRAAEAALPLGKLWVKREEHNPTGSFKARGMSAAVSVAAGFGVRTVAVNSNGNAASALAAYAAHAGMACYAFVPRDCPGPIVEECAHYGAHTYLVDGLIHDAGAIIQEGELEQGWHHVGTLREPGRTEGKKTMGFELAEQLGWRLPDVIVYPTGGGSGVIGMYRAFQQLRELGLIDGELPRFVCVQEAGCQPLVDALAGGGGGRGDGGAGSGRGDGGAGSGRGGADGGADMGADMVAGMSADMSAGTSGRRGMDADADAGTGGDGPSPTGMRVPQPHDVGMLADIVRRTGGTAVAVTAGQIADAQQALGRNGISASPEGGAAWAGMLRLCEAGWIGAQDEVVLFNTAHAMKYWPLAARTLAARTLPVVGNYRDWLKARQAATEESPFGKI